METATPEILLRVEAALRECARVLPVPVGLIEVTGSDRLDLIQRISTNDLQHLRPGRVAQTIFTTEKGRMVDVVTLAELGDRLILACTRGNEDQLIEWIEKFCITEDIALKEVTPYRTMEYFVGPKVFATVSAYFGTEIAASLSTVLKTSGNTITVLAVHNQRENSVLMVRERSEEEERGGRSTLGNWWERNGYMVLDDRAYVAYRSMRGIPALPSEISDEFSPYDANLVDLVSYTKGCYVGQEVIARLDTYQKIRRGMVGISSHNLVEELAVPFLLYNGKVDVGRCTTLSSRFGEGGFLGLAIVRSGIVQPGNTLSSAPGATPSFLVHTLPMEMPAR